MPPPRTSTGAGGADKASLTVMLFKLSDEPLFEAPAPIGPEGPLGLVGVGFNEPEKPALPEVVSVPRQFKLLPAGGAANEGLLLALAVA